ncbi:MAG: hypothetical protein ABFR47_03455 [Verrucomicrobiota bacterium]
MKNIKKPVLYADWGNSPLNQTIYTILKKFILSFNYPVLKKGKAA